MIFWLFCNKLKQFNNREEQKSHVELMLFMNIKEKKKQKDFALFRKGSTGFTLVELIIYIALLSAFLLVLTNVFVTILRVRNESQASSSVEQDGRFILNRLSYDINRATNATVTSPDTMTLIIGGQNHTYSVNSSKLQLVSPSGTDFLNGSLSTVSNLTFQEVANTGGLEETIKLQFTLESTTLKGISRETRSFSTTIGRRIR